jgi:hypothetical protein
MGNDTKAEQAPSALETQIGGDHYRKMVIQPIEYIYANKIPFIEGCIIKYASRWRDKGGIADLNKIIHFVELLKEMEREYKTGNDVHQVDPCTSAARDSLGKDAQPVFERDAGCVVQRGQGRPLG